MSYSWDCEDYGDHRITKLEDIESPEPERPLSKLEKIACSALSFTLAPIGLGGIGYVTGGILGSSWDAAEIGGYIGAGLGLFFASVISEEIFYERDRDIERKEEEFENYYNRHPPEKKDTPRYDIGNIGALEKNLSATKRVKTGKGHHEVCEEVVGVTGAHSSGGTYREITTLNSRWVPEYKGVPDEEIRDEAKSKLKYRYANASWYSAQYAAGVALGKDKRELDTKLDLWVYKLYEITKKTKKTTKSIPIAFEEREIWPGGDDNRGGPCGTESVPTEYAKRSVDIPDLPIRLGAIMDLGELYKLSKSRKVKRILRKVYLNNESRFIRRQAGKALGYSRIRVMSQDHPIVSSVASLSAIGLAAYNLIQHLV